MALFDALWFSEHHKYWALDLDMECCNRGALIMPAYLGLHNVEVFLVPLTTRCKHYVGIPD